MGLGLGTRRVVVVVLVAAGLAGGAGSLRGQGSVALTEPSAPLLPEKFGVWKRVVLLVQARPGYSLANTSKDALKECGLVQTVAAD